MGKFVRPVLAAGLLFLTAGCATIGVSLDPHLSAHALTESAEAVRDAAPVPAPVPRELAMEVLPPHAVVPGDVLRLQSPAFAGPLAPAAEQAVLPDGTIDLARYGRPMVAGRTVPEVEAVVAAAVAAQEKKPAPVAVRLVARPADVVYVFGEVNRPGAYPITGSDTVLSAIAKAGGPTRKASGRNAVLSRPSHPDGCRIVFPVCLANIVQLGDTTTNYQLLPGDRIYVAGKTLLECLFPSYCRTSPACARPQVSCFGPCSGGQCNTGGCATGGCPPQPAPGGPAVSPPVPAVPHIPPIPPAPGAAPAPDSIPPVPAPAPVPSGTLPAPAPLPPVSVPTTTPPVRYLPDVRPASLEVAPPPRPATAEIEL
jgi:protein involved in polysaccharide export with SLBB domain